MRHRFARARVEIAIQIVTDGENSFQTYVRDFFPEALHTVDIYHVFEYLWKAGECLHKEGSEELARWEPLHGAASRQDAF